MAKQLQAIGVSMDVENGVEVAQADGNGQTLTQNGHITNQAQNGHSVNQSQNNHLLDIAAETMAALDAWFVQYFSLNKHQDKMRGVQNMKGLENK